MIASSVSCRVGNKSGEDDEVSRYGTHCLDARTTNDGVNEREKEGSGLQRTDDWAGVYESE